ncbi:MAG: hypothetical protein HZA08_01425 [Nitrospirae bacterium]|nr:hypothetical protein [Nitrospirota bacterium]
MKAGLYGSLLCDEGKCTGSRILYLVIFIVVICVILTPIHSRAEVQPYSDENQQDKNGPPILNIGMDRRGFLTPPDGFSSEDQVTPQSLIDSSIEDSQEESPRAQPGSKQFKTEVVGFILIGNKPWEVLKIEDLDIIVDTVSHKRFLPLQRLLRVFNIEKVTKENEIFFEPSGNLKVVLNILKKEVRINDDIKSIELIPAISDITMEREIYLPADMVSGIFPISVKWNEEYYGFEAKPMGQFAMDLWKLPKHSSLLAISAYEFTDTLPEAHPPSHPKKNSLDFAEFRLRSQMSSGDNIQSKGLILDSFQQNLWGNLGGGEYRLQITQPPVFVGQKDHPSIKNEATFMLEKVDWTYRFPNTEITAGDSIFGLNDLIFPVVKAAGIRVNGYSANTFDEAGSLQYNKTLTGLNRYFIQPYVFEGPAPSGSDVQLIVNDRIIETQKSITGAYRFTEIKLPPGILHDIHIIITDPDGVKTDLHKRILGSSMLLPAGSAAYIAGLGSKREDDRWAAHGSLVYGRVLYGITEDLTIGGILAAQRDIYNSYPFPRDSNHLGVESSWRLFDSLVLSGDLAFSRDESELHDDFAYKLNGDIYPQRNTDIHVQYFSYGQNFFNGENILLHDREGYVLNGKWRPYQKTEVGVASGMVRDNLRHERNDTLSVNFQNMEITSSLLPRSTIAFDVNRVSPDWEGEPKALYTYKIVVTPLSDLSLDAVVSRGDSLVTGEHSDFLSGLRLPGLPMNKTPSVSTAVRKYVTENNSVGLSYMEYEERRRTSLSHSFRIRKSYLFQAITDLGYDMDIEKLFWENRFEYRCDAAGRSRIWLQNRFENDEWRFVFLLEFDELFSFKDGYPARITNNRINPERGGVHGTVFLDFNANAVRDPGEPGIEDVKVILDSYQNAVSDRNGYFIIQDVTQAKKARVFLDIDTIPAIYSPTHGIQTAYINPGNLTEVNFGITPVITISGFVFAAEYGNGYNKSIRGIRILLTDSDMIPVTNSITAGNGSFFLGNIRPGRYIVQIDSDTLPKGYTAIEKQREIEVVGGDKPQEIKLPPFEIIPVNITNAKKGI